MHLDFPTTTLLASLPYLLTPPSVGQVAVGNDVVGTSFNVAFSLQAIFGVIHESFVTHLGRRQMHRQRASSKAGRPLLQIDRVESSFDCLGLYLIGDPHAPGDDSPPAGIIIRHASTLLLLILLCANVPSFRPRQHG